MCDHNLEEVFRAGYEDDIQTVVRWCIKCGAVVVDGEFDGRIRAGHVLPMRLPDSSQLEQQLSAEREARKKAEADALFVIGAKREGDEPFIDAIERRWNKCILAKLTAEADRSEYKQRAESAERTE